MEVRGPAVWRWLWWQPELGSALPGLPGAASQCGSKGAILQHESVKNVQVEKLYIVAFRWKK